MRTFWHPLCQLHLLLGYLSVCFHVRPEQRLGSTDCQRAQPAPLSRFRILSCTVASMVAAPALALASFVEAVIEPLTIPSYERIISSFRASTVWRRICRLKTQDVLSPPSNVKTTGRRLPRYRFQLLLQRSPSPSTYPPSPSSVLFPPPPFVASSPASVGPSHAWSHKHIRSLTYELPSCCSLRCCFTASPLQNRCLVDVIAVDHHGPGTGADIHQDGDHKRH